jgi:hypothetical protein
MLAGIVIRCGFILSDMLTQVWSAIEKYLDVGVSLIPVYDKQTGDIKPKSPCGSVKRGNNWEQFQKRIIGKNELWEFMESYNTTAVGMVCGKVSGNLEVIDLDVKFNLGFDAQLFADIAKFYPLVWERLRIHKTPSGGYHIIYRCETEVEGNKKLAGLLNEEGKQVNFIETRGEGGYALLPPSLNYSVYRDVPIPVLTEDERASLLTLCRSYNQIIKKVREPKATKKDNGYYSTNPFDDFNSSTKAESILEDFGWSYFNENANYIYYTRYGRERVISGSFSKSHRLYYIFTTSTELDSQKWLSPSALLAELKFSGDFKQLRKYLIEQGYGKLSERVEESIVKKAVLKNKALPTNISDRAKEEFERAKTEAQNKYPYGIFWEYNEKGVVVINRNKYSIFLTNAGFRNYIGDAVRIVGKFIYDQTIRDIIEMGKAYVQEDDGEYYDAIVNAYDAFIERHHKHVISNTLKLLETDAIAKDEKEVAYKFYRNCYVVITAKGGAKKDYETFDKLIWYKDIQHRDYRHATDEEVRKSVVYEFYDKACKLDDYVMRCIGYLIHGYRHPSEAYFIVLTEEVEDPKSGGGSGKNIFCNLLSYMTSYKFVPGSMVSYDAKFLQVWKGQKIVGIMDISANFKFEFVKSISDGEATVKHLYKDERTIPIDQMPRFIFTTNFSFDVTDGGLKRRIRYIEFTDYFTKAGGVDTTLGKRFPDDWSDDDWAAYDNLMLGCLQSYLANPKLKNEVMSDTGWLKQFKQNHGEMTLEFIRENWEKWLLAGDVKVDDFNGDYNTFCSVNNISQMYKKSSTKLNQAISDYCDKNGVQFDKDFKRQGIRYKLFNKKKL